MNAGTFNSAVFNAPTVVPRLETTRRRRYTVNTYTHPITGYTRIVRHRLDSLVGRRDIGTVISGVGLSRPITMLAGDGRLQQFFVVIPALYRISAFNYTDRDVSLQLDVILRGSVRRKSAFAAANQGRATGVINVYLRAGTYTVNTRTFTTTDGVQHFVVNLKLLRA